MSEGEEGELNNDADGTVHNNSTTADDDEGSQLATSCHPCSLRHDKEDPLTLRDGQGLVDDEDLSSLSMWKPSIPRNPAIPHYHPEHRGYPLQSPPARQQGASDTSKPAVGAPVRLVARRRIVCPRWWTWPIS